MAAFRPAWPHAPRRGVLPAGAGARRMLRTTAPLSVQATAAAMAATTSGATPGAAGAAGAAAGGGRGFGAGGGLLRGFGHARRAGVVGELLAAVEQLALHHNDQAQHDQHRHDQHQTGDDDGGVGSLQRQQLHFSHNFPHSLQTGAPHSGRAEYLPIVP